MKWDGEDKGCGMRIPCMKSNEMYTIQYDANYFGFRRFDVQNYGAERRLMGISPRGISGV